MAKFTTTAAARLLGIHPDTLRKRAKKGLVPFTKNVLGHMEFDAEALWAYRASPAPAPVKKQQTKVIIIIDQSSSMGGLEQKMQAAVSDQVQSLVAASDSNNTFEIAHILFADTVQPTSTFLDARLYQAPLIRTYGNTNLHGAMFQALMLIDMTMKLNPDEAYLVNVITDGENNRYDYSATTIKDIVQRLNATDRLTLVANCPPNSERRMTDLGIAPGNIRAWDGTAHGLATLSVANSLGSSNYAATRSTGVTSSTSFYANVPVNVDKTVGALASTMVDITKNVSVERVGSTQNDIAIRKFADLKFGGFQKGKLYYELTKKEKVQEYKGIIVQDRKTGKFYQGWDQARKLLGLPAFQNGEIKVAPGNLGDFTVFVQSTSVNRKLKTGTAVVHVP